MSIYTAIPQDRGGKDGGVIFFFPYTNVSHWCVYGHLRQKKCVL